MVVARLVNLIPLLLILAASAYPALATPGEEESVSRLKEFLFGGETNLSPAAAASASKTCASAVLSAGIERSVRTLVTSEDGDFIAAGLTSGEVLLWTPPIKTPFRLTASKKQHVVNGLALLPDASGVVTLWDDTSVRIEFLRHGQSVDKIYKAYQVEAPGLRAPRMKVSGDGKWLCLASSMGVDPSVYVVTLDRMSPGKLFPLPGADKSSTLIEFAFAPAALGSVLVTSGWDGEVRFLDLNHLSDNGILRKKNRTHNAVFSLQFSPDGRRLVGGTRQGEILIWETERLASGKMKFEMIDSKMRLRGATKISEIIFSLTSQNVALLSDDRTPEIWDVERNFRVGSLGEDLRKPVTRLVFTRQERVLAIEGRNLYLFDETKPLSPLSQIAWPDPLTAISVSKDGSVVNVGTSRGSVIIFPAPHTAEDLQRLKPLAK